MSQNKKNQFNDDQIKLSRFAKALSHPARIAIIEHLAKVNSCICGEIVEIMPLAQSTVSQHLKELKDAGIITGEISGPKICYCINRETIYDMEKLLKELLSVINKENSDKKGCC
ncbi:MAG TPA: metalloregulator ArsR/SmtB family transcription factor [Spirochaetota bacterium]|jgi:DNA-binding transcriptional ArsR family regulator|nr:winged helix-turn-helix transcriptional regulator [Spirochaetota bacterium]OQA95446.1 MAG: HTH-type transcriptional repressor SmtB [Spirochaetes bacterium ADurb.Bin218]HOK01336.1 metalloregulator ArsR/SmtB family transcription factor [Spirochaetota bacterium]HOK93092.1 metalloregulator ArsR/SmtB family transcription factor [Spirochaetota bacterium]HON16784.1 metalloregulator ArsR/SmtB family transcription factor [Spirochaetota bacterium]